MPRTPRNPGSGKTPKNGPAKGPGWGGPPRGNKGDRPPLGERAAEALLPNAALHYCERDPATGLYRLSPKGEKAQAVAEIMLASHVNIALNSEFEGARASAQIAVMDRVWGKPRQASDVSVSDSDQAELVIRGGLPPPVESTG